MWIKGYAQISPFQAPVLINMNHALAVLSVLGADGNYYLRVLAENYGLGQVGYLPVAHSTREQSLEYADDFLGKSQWLTVWWGGAGYPERGLVRFSGIKSAYPIQSGANFYVQLFNPAVNQPLFLAGSYPDASEALKGAYEAVLEKAS
jgi:hypothetical protein